MTPPRPSPVVSVLRIGIGAAVVAILLHTYLIGIPLRGANLFDYFGYFTNLTSLLTAVVGIGVGVLGLCGRAAPPWLVSARAVSVASMIVVAFVYNLVVPGTGSAPAWVSLVLHTLLPVIVLADWVLSHDRRPQPWSELWLVLPYPLLWLVVVLVRGRTDGWVPYGFLLPERGTLALALTVAALFATLLISAALVCGLSRVPSPWPARPSDDGQAVAQP